MDDHEKRISEAEKAIKAHAQLLGTHGQILEEHGERLHTREEIADQHAVSILNLQVREWACACLRVRTHSPRCLHSTPEQEHDKKTGTNKEARAELRGRAGAV